MSIVLSCEVGSIGAPLEAQLWVRGTLAALAHCSSVCNIYNPAFSLTQGLFVLYRSCGNGN